MQRSRNVRIVAIYLVVSFLYVYFSDQAVEALLPSRLHAVGHTYKGWAYIALTGLYFYIMLASSALENSKERGQRESIERQMKILLENVPGVAYRCLDDEVWTMLYISEGILELSGYNVEEIFPPGGLTFEELIHPEDRDHVRRTVQAQARTFRSYNLTYRITRKDEHISWVWERGQVIGQNKEGVNILEGYIVDISERIGLSDQMSELNLRMNALFKNAPSGILFLKDSKYVDANPAALEMLGYSREEMLALTPEMLMDFPQNPTLNEIRAAFREGGELTKTLQLRKKDGRLLPVEFNAIADVLPGMHIAMFDDISQKIEYEAQLETQLTRLRALSNMASMISASADVRQTYGAVLIEAVQALHADGGVILDYDPASMHLTFSAGAELRSEPPTEAFIALGQSLAGRSLLTQTPVIIPDIREVELEAAFQKLMQREGFVGYVAIPLQVAAQYIGVLEIFHVDPFTPSQEWLNLATTLANEGAAGIHAAQTRRDLETANQQLRLAYETTLQGWARALEYRDRETEGHSDRVTDVTVDLARRLNVHPDDLIYIRWGARLHDIGKMAVPDHILLKEGPLTEEEWVTMRKHPVRGYELLKEIPFLGSAVEIPHYHHEKWDGSGYPNGLKGEAIPLGARLFAVVDVWDALSHDRPYRKAWPMEDVIAYIKKENGIHFDPDVVEAFLEYLVDEGWVEEEMETTLE